MILQVWISYANFELSIQSENGENVKNARKVYSDGNKSLKNNNVKEERLMLLESWQEMEVWNSNISQRYIETKILSSQSMISDR